MDFTGKRILVFDKTLSLNQAFTNSLTSLGFEVISFNKESYPKFSKNWTHRLLNIFNRRFLKNKNYLVDQEKKHLENQMILRMKELRKNNQNHYDYGLFFRADLYPEQVVKSAREICEVIVSDQYDGLSVSHNIFNYISYFDRIFVFDPDDYRNHKNRGFLPITNCWFLDNLEDINTEYDFYYVGVNNHHREQKIMNLQKFSNSNSLVIKALLTINSYLKESDIDGISFSHTGIDHWQNIKNLQKSRAIVDFKLDYHNGLSFRFFEAMKYEKKLITNNCAVKDYDFYHPDNIFICDFENFEGLNEFLEKPYHKIEEKIKNKYGFENWIHYVLNEPNFERINLP